MPVSPVSEPSDARRRNMAAIRGKNTKPELLVRHELHSRGYRYRLHVKSLPGTPDIVLPRFNAVVLVNGCFWHGHNCDLFKWPKTREEFWHEKISGTQTRDIENWKRLTAEGWRVAVLWQCSLGSKTRLQETISDLEIWLSATSHEPFETGSCSRPR